MRILLKTAPTIEPMISETREPKRERQSGIYQILCKPTGKVYIGSAVYLTQRKGEHRRALLNGKHHSVKLQRAWNKYGAESFIYTVLEFCNEDNLIEREQYYIDKYDTASKCHGYNVNPTAGSGLGYKHTLETRKRISEKSTGRKHTAEVRQRMSELKTGIKMNLSPQEIDNRRKRMLGNSWSVGIKHSEETKAKLRGNNNARGHRRTDEQRDKLSAAHSPLASDICDKIRESYNKGIASMEQLAREIGCCRRTICNVINHRIRAYQ